MNGVSIHDPDCSEFVEVDPTGRYGRYNEILGKGASKTVYRAFDEYEGIEVAWNQVKLYDFLQSPDDLERLYCEIHLLKTLKHRNIMKFYTSWVDTANRNINFVTEMFTSGTLREYRLKHRKVNIRAMKRWCRQILNGLLYLHSHDPPVIHRDLKCDNIFVNGNQGEVKIGDFGLAAILRKSHAAHCVGTPEFMAPEVYEEEYNELVDIYSFGMCILEMVTFEYPYSECTNPAQIYKKVTSGKKPDALYKVKDPEVREFIEKCLATVSSRLSARELLSDPFLRVDDCDNDLRLIDCRSELEDFGPLIRQPFLEHCTSDGSYMNSYSNSLDLESYKEWGHYPIETDISGIELFEHHDDEHSPDVDISIKGKRRDDGSIFLRLRISDKEGRIRNIYFPFDIESDTALSVATEMVEELDMTDLDVNSIADMIDAEIASLVPKWRPGLGIEEETPRFSLCQTCASTHTSIGSFMDFLSNPNLPFFKCPNGCAAAMHGRFEEVTYQLEESDHPTTEPSDPCPGPGPSKAALQQMWDRCESFELSTVGSGSSHSDEEHANQDQPISAENCSDNAPTDDYENRLVQWELRWLKAKYQLELRDVRDNQLGISPRSSTARSFHGDPADESFSLRQENAENSEFQNFHKSCPISKSQRARNCEAMGGSYRALQVQLQNLELAKDFNSLLPSTLHRTTSLPVDAVYL
ncbi:hypothetical protein Cgig2_003505 [Carnegiea gigantea]|uniref:non-specific serine/threonine protein kinase n=1 Tax=Carnegiea gigantea TaxID=171969 RepID=A0A9Q1KB16_9CARY|nr:hypothetical protein Cgig2_003505 [Carnegiea gigantea]